MQATCVFLKNLLETQRPHVHIPCAKESSYTSCIPQQDSSGQMRVVAAEVGVYTLAVVVILLFNTVSNFTIINSTLKLLLNHVIKYCVLRI